MDCIMQIYAVCAHAQNCQPPFSELSLYDIDLKKVEAAVKQVSDKVHGI